MLHVISLILVVNHSKRKRRKRIKTKNTVQSYTIKCCSLDTHMLLNTMKEQLCATEYHMGRVFPIIMLWV